jgi:hypothetical protein
VEAGQRTCLRQTPRRAATQATLICTPVQADQNPSARRHADGPVVGLTGARFGGAAGRRRRAAVELPEEPDDGAVPHRCGDKPLVGQTGARFAAATRSTRTGKGSQAGPDRMGPVERQPGAHAAQVPPAQWSSAQRVPAPLPAARPARVTSIPESERADWDAVAPSFELVRPYFWTKGRTAPRFELSVETLVSATAQAIDPELSPEQRTILELCRTPRSVAELAALLPVPLGVARVVLADLAELGAVMVHATAGSADTAPDLDLMRRVLAGLQRL